MPDSTMMLSILELLAELFIFVVGLAMLAIVVVFIVDITQRKQAIRRNYPVIGHLRYFFESEKK